MTYSTKIVLHCPNGEPERMTLLVEDFIKDGVELVAVVGMDCSRIEDIIDEIVVGDGDRDYDLLTTSHPGETVDQVVKFARSLHVKNEQEVQVVVL